MGRGVSVGIKTASLELGDSSVGAFGINMMAYAQFPGLT